MTYIHVVNELYYPGRTRYPQADEVRLGPLGCELVRYWSSPSQDDIDQHRGPGRFAVVDAGPDLLLLAYRFGNHGWSDTPFQAHRMPPHERGLPDGGLADALLLITVLVDADTGIIRNLHGSTLSSEVSDALRNAVRTQLSAPFDDPAAGRKLGAIYSRFSTSRQMVKKIATAVCGPQ